MATTRGLSNLIRSARPHAISPSKEKIAAPAGTDHKGPPSGKHADGPAGHADLVAGPQGQEQHASGRAAATSHEEEKTALIAEGVGVGLVALWLRSR